MYVGCNVITGLAQNYPNPFNRQTTISYELSSFAEVTLTVFDQVGRHVVTLVRANQPAGMYRIDWDGRDDAGRQMASGVYLYRLQAGAFEETRKMVLVR